MTPLHVTGEELREGDTIEVWWQPNRATITKLRPYNPPAAMGLPPGKWQFATFAVGPEMTIEPGGTYTVLHRQ